MPFDGTTVRDLNAGDTGIFPKWSLDWWRFRIKSFRGRRERNIGDLCDHREAVIHLLRDARSLIADEHRWVRGSYWRFPDRRCAMGALRAVARQLDDVTVTWMAHAALLQIADRRSFRSVEYMNDNSSHSQILGAFDEAIALAGSRRR